MPTNIIPKMFIKDVHNNLQNLNNHIDQKFFFESNMFEKFNNIDHDKIVLYVFIFVIIYFVLNNYEIKFSKVITIIVGIGMVFIFTQHNYYANKHNERDLKIQTEFIEQLLFDNNSWYAYDITEKFNIVPVPNYLYIQYIPELLKFFYNNKDFGQYNMDSYVLSIVHCNNIGNLQMQILKNMNNDYQLLEIMKTEIGYALNAFESIIHKINVVHDIDHKSDDLQLLLNNIYTKCLMTIVNRNESVENSIHKKPNSILMQSLYTGEDDTKTMHYSPHYDYY
jgi:hypothetical protein